jgi:hypothetical protein
MKSINVNDVALGAAMPYKSTMIDWIKTGEAENNSAIVNALTYNNPPAYLALYGCTSTVVGSTYTITAGAIVEGGTISITNSSSTVTLGAGQVIIGTISTIYPTVGSSDPVTFSDGTTHNVHAQTTIVWSAGTSGSGDFNYSDLVFINAPEATYDTYVKYSKIQGLVTIQGIIGAGYASVGSSAGTTSFTLPAGYRPTSNKSGFFVFYDTVSGNIIISGQSTLTVDTNGKVYFAAFTGAGTARHTQIFFTFPIF